MAAFQINQEKLVRMLGNIQAMFLVGWRLCKLYEGGKMTPGHASMGKASTLISVGADFSYCCTSYFSRYMWNLTQAWISLRARETVSLGRELMGGNGILSDFLVAKV